MRRFFRFFRLLVATVTCIILLNGLARWTWEVKSIIHLYRSPVLHELRETTDTIEHIHNSSHLMVSAFKDYRYGAVRVISILRRSEPKKLYCVLCYHARAERVEASQCVSSEAVVEMHSDHYGFPYGTSDILCNSLLSIEPRHVAISMGPINVQNLKYLPIQNQKTKDPFKYSFTVCISSLFGEYNNALQFVQTMEVYKLIGIQRVVIYNTSCGPDVEKLLKHYSEEGMVEVVPWPIDKYLKPSHGWQPEESPGDLHYYGQLTTLNECIYRHMYQSQYLLMNDLDEIIMPYKHASLGDLMETLEKQHPDAGVFIVENPIFPKTQFDDSGRFSRREWRNVPGVNILEHIYREPEHRVDKPTKMIINPRYVEQTSVHEVLKHFGPSINVQFDVCHTIHVRVPLNGSLHKNQLHEDKKLWEFEKKLIPNINRALYESGLLR